MMSRENNLKVLTASKLSQKTKATATEGKVTPSFYVLFAHALYSIDFRIKNDL